MKESDLYDSVEKFLEVENECFFHCQEAGKHHFGSVDVFGVRYKNSQKSEIETIGVEVKRYKHSICANLGQAKGYSLFCDRVYFAFPRFEVTEEDKEAANSLGVGLIKIEGENPNFVCKKILEAPIGIPLDKLRDYVLRSKKIFQCKSCKIFRDYHRANYITTEKSWKEMTPWAKEQILKRDKGLRIRRGKKREFYCSSCAKEKLSENNAKLA